VAQAPIVSTTALPSSPSSPVPRITARWADDGPLVLVLEGDWILGQIPPVEDVERTLRHRPPARVAFDSDALGRWDSGLFLFVARLEPLVEAAGARLDRDGLPPGLRRLMALAEAAPRRGARASQSEGSAFLEQVGATTLAAGDRAGAVAEFVGSTVFAMGRWATGRARYRRVDLLANLQEAGLEALPVVGLVSFLLGLILAFVGAIQLQLFDATIFVADLVGIAMVRDMAALMTAVVMAGRSGASYAAQLGTMQVNQEVDALTTLGISPMEYLVLPRVLALVLMLPLLTVFADVIGILGGAFVGVGILDLSAIGYYQQTVGAVTLTHFLGGLVKAATYGALVGLAGCYQGMRAERSSSGVGQAATAAVVNGIVLVISACGVYAVLFYVLGL
jgi:phospholipid/cholesterol/gamma-HCH transport system permease protein